MGNSPNTLLLFEKILEKYHVLQTIRSVEVLGWDQVLENFQTRFSSTQFQDEEEKHIYVDLFFSQCLKFIDESTSISVLVKILDKWAVSRNIEGRCGWLKQGERISLIHFAVKLREKLTHILLSIPPEAFQSLSEVDQRLLTSIWRHIFFEPFSALALYWNPVKSEQESLIAQLKSSGYSGLLVASMYQPFSADDYSICAQDLFSSSLPFCYKAIISFWMVNTPYFHGTEKHRLKLMNYVPQLCEALINNSEMISTFYFFAFVQEVMTGFWRASYIGGNNVVGLVAFGNLITRIMQSSFPYPQPKTKPNKSAQSQKLKIGYISRNFFKQAVSCYMVNRIRFHSDQFEVHIFAIGEYEDDVTELFKQHCQSFQRFTNLADLKSIADAIFEKDLDILIYADIGMDPVTYMLSGLCLAPVQCALVGHGTTTGMPHIHYYLSGDFEGPQAQNHYSEQLIKLPVLGAAQYLPMKPEKHLTRQDLGIPDDAIVFISCANGLKHGLSRNHLLIEILKQAPNTYILLKPYAHYSSIDYKFSEEIVAAAQEAGVEQRLKIIPPIADAKHVLGLLSIADVQLDTYPYGGWTTNMEALYMGLPIITQQGELARSRWGSGMLKALKISEGIAKDETEYVACAVRLAQDKELLLRLKKRIRKNVKKVLFNGLKSQQSYEATLIKIYQNSYQAQSPATPPQTLQQSLLKSTVNPVVVTSIFPGNTEIQRQALKSWQQAGFKVVSINTMNEIDRLRDYFDLDFIATPRDARTEYGKPYIYFDDILTYFKTHNIEICGIINSDIHLIRPGFYDTVQKEALHSFLFGSSLDVESFSQVQPFKEEVLRNDFDYFFFPQNVIRYYAKQHFCLGLPWCDYWAVLVPLMHKLSVKKISSPVAAHIKHNSNYDQEIWTKLGECFAQNFKPPYLLSNSNLMRYAQDTLITINTLSQNLALSPLNPDNELTSHE